MLIKKEANTQNEMIYEYYPNANNKVAWTKIYFIIIFACLVKQPETNNQVHKPNSICLENNIENLNDGFQILNEFKKSSNLLPNYVSNISYEAYKTDTNRQHDTTRQYDDENFHSNGSNVSTSVVICLAIVILAAITLVLGVLLRQNAVKKVKAPIWFPPTSDNGPNSEYATTIHNNEAIYEKVQANKEIKYGHSAPLKNNAWSINKAFDDFTHIFHQSKQINKIGEISPTSSSSGRDSNSDDSDLNPPVKMRRLDLSSAIPIQHSNQPSTPEYYPSPPESLPDSSFHGNMNNSIQNNPINYKGGFQAITPLMLFIMGRSKLKQNTKFTNYQSQNNRMVESEIIDTFISNGADMNAKNSEGETALHLAARCGLLEIAKSLISNGADLNAFDNSGRNCLHTSVGSNEFEIVKLILNHCSISSYNNNDNSNNDNQMNLVMDDKFDLVDSKTNDDLGDTPLIIAARLNFNNIVQLLIDFNASVNSTDNEGRSALHWCSKVNNLNGALLLIQSGANVNMQDNDEKTPLSSALGELFTKDVADLLIKFDAFVSTEDEIKYNKMKTIVDTFKNSNTHSSHSFNVDAIKNDLFNKIKQEPTSFLNQNKKMNNLTKECLTQRKEQTNKTSKLIGVSTKRKLSETITSQTESVKTENKKHQSKSFSKQTMMEQPLVNNNQLQYTPLTPSPPMNSSHITNRADQFQPFSVYPSTNQNGFYFNQTQTQQDNFRASYNQVNQINNGNVNLAYLNENKHYFEQNFQNNGNLNNFQLQSGRNMNFNLFNSNFIENESYAAYF